MDQDAVDINYYYTPEDLWKIEGYDSPYVEVDVAIFDELYAN